MTIKHLTFGLVLTFALASCEKVIELDITDSDRRIVIDAQLFEGSNFFNVNVSESTLYNEAGLNSPVLGAQVVLEDDMGGSTTIPYFADGWYSTSVTALPGHLYTLKVTYDNVTYTAQSYMTSDVSIDNIYSEVRTNTFSDETGNAVFYEFTDPAGVDNFYRTRVYVDNVLLNDPEDLRTIRDFPRDGLLNDYRAQGGFFDSGAEVMVELMHIDENSHLYLSTLGDIIGSSNAPSPTPSNPVTNWNNDALGAFIAYNTDSARVVIP